MAFKVSDSFTYRQDRYFLVRLDLVAHTHTHTHTQTQTLARASEHTI
jgi:hypothetical protein